jgi:hypothetical protein
MNEPLTGLSTYGKYLLLLKANSIIVTENNGMEPYKWPQQHYSDIGTDDDFVRELTLDFKELLHGTQVFGSQRTKAEIAMVTLLVEGLLPAYTHLLSIETSSAQDALLKRLQRVEDYISALWRAYRTLFPKLTKILGFEISFLFQDDADFLKGVATFEKDHPNVIGIQAFFKTQRDGWQNELANFRNNFIEHRNIPRAQFDVYYEGRKARETFELVWQVIEETLIVFLASYVRNAVGVARVPKADQNKSHPRCFRWVIRESSSTI